MAESVDRASACPRAPIPLDETRTRPFRLNVALHDDGSCHRPVPAYAEPWVWERNWNIVPGGRTRLCLAAYGATTSERQMRCSINSPLGGGGWSPSVSSFADRWRTSRLTWTCSAEGEQGADRGIDPCSGGS